MGESRNSNSSHKNVTFVDSEAEQKTRGNVSNSFAKAAGQSTSFLAETSSLSGYQGNSSSLKFLSPVNKLTVDQSIRQQRSFSHCHRQKLHRIIDSNGEVICSALTTCNFEMFKMTFQVTFTDNNDRNFMRIERSAGWFKTNVEVLLDNILLGTVNQKWLSLKACFEVRDPNGNIIYKITVPSILNKTTCTFKIHRGGQPDSEVAEIVKEFHWLTGMKRSTADVFSMSFSVNTSIDVKHKALLLAAALFIDFVCYERYRRGNYPSL